MKYLRAVITVGALVAGIVPFSFAQEGEALVEKGRCYSCHQLSEPSLGPPWQAIAARHAPRREIMGKVLAAKILRGGGGNWGNVPMVPNQWLSEEEAQKIAEWVLDQ